MTATTKCACGGKAVPAYMRNIETARYAWTVHCLKCGRQGGWYATMEKAVLAWGKAMSQPSLFEEGR